jgi:23S rRNA pseudouridine955/2504/2580 synthase
MEQPEDRTELTAGPDDAGRRLDKVLRSLLPDLGLSEIYGSLRRGAIRVNGLRAAPDLRLSEGDRISIAASMIERGYSTDPGNRIRHIETASLLLEDLVLLRTEHLLFLNKPRGLLSHGAGSLEEMVRAALPSRTSRSLAFRPGPLHRLDRNSSGLITFPVTAAGARVFSALLRERRLRKLYLALLDGRLSRPAEWHDRITRDSKTFRSAVSEDGAEASASVYPLLTAEDRSLVLIELHTGLTHQIRVQASSRGFPLSGDVKYGGRRAEGGYFLHAAALEFLEQPFPDVPSRVTAAPPEEARARLRFIFGRNELDQALDAALR